MSTPTDDVVKNNLKIYLLKDGLKDFSDVIKPTTSIKKVDLNEDSRLYYRESVEKEPAWIESFFRNNKAIDKDDFKTSIVRAICIIKVKHKGKLRFFTIPFGAGRFLMNDGLVEERFGLKVTLNVLEAKSIRGMDKMTLSSNPKVSREQISKASPASEFEINIEKDLILSLTGKSNTGDLGGAITGKDALSVYVNVDIGGIVKFLKTCLDIYVKKDYQTDFKWIDQIQEVKNQSVIDNLHSRLVTEIKAKSNNVWFAVPDIVDWADFSGFKYSTRKTDSTTEFLEIEDLLLQKEFSGDFSVDDLKSHHICYWNETANDYKYKWTMYSCLNAEIDFKTDAYVLANSKWYRISKNFVKEINDEIKTIKQVDLKLPKFNHKDENEYNQVIAKQLGGAFLDANNKSYGGGHSKIEFCDVFTHEKKMLFVKLYGSSAVLSHLFNQGYVSGELLVSDQDFRAMLRKEVMPKAYVKHIPTKRPTATDYTIIYTIIETRVRDTDHNLPFFSKVALRRCRRILEAFGYKVQLCWVQSK